MNTAKKFLALALQAYQGKQFEEAGCLFAQAAECSDVTKLTNALLEPVADHLADSQQPITADNQQQLASDQESEDDEWGDESKPTGEEGSEVEGVADEEGSAEDEEDEEEGDEGDHEFRGSAEASDSTSSSPIRRRVTSMYQIGKILAASMEATSSEDLAYDGELGEDAEDEDDETPEPDPDVPGERLIPVSFSAVTVKKGFAVKSPVKLKQ